MMKRLLLAVTLGAPSVVLAAAVPVDITTELADAACVQAWVAAGVQQASLPRLAVMADNTAVPADLKAYLESSMTCGLLCANAGAAGFYQLLVDAQGNALGWKQLATAQDKAQSSCFNVNVSAIPAVVTADAATSAKQGSDARLKKLGYKNSILMTKNRAVQRNLDAERKHVKQLNQTVATLKKQLAACRKLSGVAQQTAKKSLPLEQRIKQAKAKLAQAKKEKKEKLVQLWQARLAKLKTQK